MLKTSSFHLNIKISNQILTGPFVWVQPKHLPIKYNSIDKIYFYCVWAVLVWCARESKSLKMDDGWWWVIVLFPRPFKQRVPSQLFNCCIGIKVMIILFFICSGLDLMWLLKCFLRMICSISIEEGTSVNSWLLLLLLCILWLLSSFNFKPSYWSIKSIDLTCTNLASVGHIETVSLGSIIFTLVEYHQFLTDLY